LIRCEKDTRKIKEVKSEEIVIREDEERMKRGEERIGAVDSETPAPRSVHLTKEQENITSATGNVFENGRGLGVECHRDSSCCEFTVFTPRMNV
jgi:hypothetical protein